MSVRDNQSIGSIEVPIKEISWSFVSFDITEDDLSRNNCKNMEEFSEKIRKNEVDVWDLENDWFDWETQDSELIATYLEDVVAFDPNGKELESDGSV
mgnify:CR=1 FL=1|tara:strand:+ start:2921 stop:3211 length:291 start_codon:yes stop_codon:yes gene_type:complete